METLWIFMLIEYANWYLRRIYQRTNVNNLAFAQYWLSTFMTYGLGVEPFIAKFLVSYTFFSSNYWRDRVDR